MELELLKDRKVMKPHQIEILKELFAEDEYPSAMRKRVLARRLDVNVMQINYWFERQRSKRKISNQLGE